MVPNELDCVATLPFLTADLPGVGGRIKDRAEDFFVEELSLYEPSGEGTHTYFVIEKRGMTTMAAVQSVARALGRQSRDIGHAGLKDARAVTRQTLSVEHIDPDRVSTLDIPGLKVLSVTQHRNKLKRGHLRGNRFVLKIRETDPTALPRAMTIMEVLADTGVPNYFGPQRFGVRGDNWLIGRSVIRGDFDQAMSVMLGEPGTLDHGDVLKARRLYDAGQLQDAADAWPYHHNQQRRACRAILKSNGDFRCGWRAIDRTLRGLFVSAYQSHLFNQVLADRMGGLNCIEAGDLAWKHANGACFRVQDVAAEQPRCQSFEISPTGPLFGHRMTEASGLPGQRESRILAAEGLELSSFRTRDGVSADGVRRPLRVPLISPALDDGTDEWGHFLRLSFTLPPGSYATCVVREVCKEAAESSID